MEKQLKMMEVILYLYEKSKQLLSLNMPMALLREDPIFERLVSIKYDVANNELAKFEEYKAAIDEYYNRFMQTNA